VWPAEVADAFAQHAIAFGLAIEATMSARVEKSTLRLTSTASMASADAGWISPVPGGPRKWIADLHPQNSAQLLFVSIGELTPYLGKPQPIRLIVGVSG
jgi:hypothetical protein